MLFLAIKAKKAVSVHAKVLSVRPTAQNAATVTFEFDDGNRASLTGNGCTLMEGETGMLCYFGGTYHSFQMDTAC